MELRVKFYNSEIPTVEFRSSNPNSKVFEITPKGGSRARKQEVSTRYLTEIDYAIKGVSNNADEHVEEIYLALENINIDVLKNNKAGETVVDDNISKYNTIIFDIAPGIVTENLYVTKGGKMSERSIIHKKDHIGSEDIREVISNHLNTGIIQKDGINNMGTDITILMAIVEKYIKGYSLKWNSLINTFQLVENGKSTVSYNQIKADDTYTFFRLLGLILDKGKHNGVFYIRAEAYRTDVLEAMLKMIDLLYKDKYVVFLYNADLTGMHLKKEKIELPNYLIMG